MLLISVWVAYRFQILAERPATLVDIIHGFPLSLQANTGTVPKISPLPYMSFPIHYSLIIFSVGAQHSKQLNKQLESHNRECTFFTQPLMPMKYNLLVFLQLLYYFGVGIAQSVWRLATNWTTEWSDL
jgi:hypothetical protein